MGLLFQDLSLVVLREIFGSELADATAKHAEYRWVPTDDGGADPFTHTIPTPGQQLAWGSGEGKHVQECGEVVTWLLTKMRVERKSKM